MNKLLLAAVLLTGLSSTAQKKNTFSLSGKIKNQDYPFVYLRYAGPLGTPILDSAKITKGTFLFRGTINEPSTASLYGKLKSQSIDDPNSTQIFLESNPMEISLVAGDFKNAIMKGSATQDEQIFLDKMKAGIRKEKQPFVDAYMKEKDHEKAAEIREKFTPFDTRADEIDFAYFKSHPDSYLTAYLMRYKISSLNASQAKQIYNNWTPRIKQSSYGKSIAEEIKKLESGSPGSIAANFNAKDINGQQISLSDFKGKKYIMLDFWASWCVPCRKGNPHLISLYQKYKDLGFEIIGVASDDSTPDAWKKAVEKDQIGIWKHVLSGLKRTASGYDKSADIGESYGIHTLPTKILIDKNGLIIGRYGGGGEDDDAMDKKLTALFNQANFNLKGNIKGQTNGYLHLSYTASGKQVKDSTLVKNGRFEFSGNITEPVIAYFNGALKKRSMEDPNYGYFFIEPGNMQLEVSEGDFKNLKLTGSKTQDEAVALDQKKLSINQQTIPISKALTIANEAYLQAKKENKSDEIQEALKEKASDIRDQFEPFNKMRDKIDLEYISQNPDSYYSAYLLIRKVANLPLDSSAHLYGKISEKVKKSSYGKEVAKEIAALKSGSTGSVASVFNTKDINGSPLSLADFKGKKYVLVDFWASWCVPCRKGNPHLLTLYRKYKAKGFEIIGVSDDDSNPEAWKKAVEKDQIGVWKHILRGLKRTPTGYDKSADISEPFGIHSLPTKILIDKNGIIIGRYGGGGENDDVLDKKLAEIFN